MIEKILSNLQAEADFFGGEPMGSLQKMYYCKGVEKAIEIVQEVEKEYGEKKYYRIVLSCLEDSTSLEMPLTKQEYLFLTRLSELVYRVATGCMPTMYVEQKGE